MASSSNFVVDADIHGLVDGHIEVERRAEALRRLAGSPADRARVEAWQTQNDLIRSAFAGVDREPLPVMLDLAARPQVQFIPANDAPLVGSVEKSRPRRGRRLATTLATAIVAVGALGGTWAILDWAEPDESVATTPLRGSVDAALVRRSTEAMGKAAPLPSGAASKSALRLPTTEIPDLRSAGFSLTGADVEASEPASILFRYQGTGSDRVIVTVARAASGEPAGPPVRVGQTYLWHKADAAYVIAGTLRPSRLRALALALQEDSLK